ncbi:MAG TPA: carboxypeptidase-like regulatory domain-containing protein [Bryobacteraceae bacterium]|nr:carboxypeptidase-like regulatory domain-containing protein [Bryobacteraceae bacterium]
MSRPTNVASIALLLCTSAALAQSGGTITGTVSDLGREAVPNAPIQAINQSTNAIYKTVSSQTGQYTLVELPPGAYRLSVAAPGFDAYVQPNIAVAAKQTVNFDIHLVDYQLGTLGDGREFRIQLTSPHATPSGPTPRTPEGKPDLSGVWFAQRPVDPGTPQPLPWAEALLKERAANNSKDAPGAHCLTRGITAAGALFPFKFVQTRALLVMIFEDDIPSHRQVFLDGRGHPKDPNPSWMGHSIGRWDGDTLVVDTVGFNDRSWLDPQGHPHTEMMRVIERFRRPDFGHLEIEFTIDDPGAYAKPWIIKRAADIDPEDDVGEYVCTENNRDVEHMVGK